MAQPHRPAPETRLSRTRARRAAALGLITALALLLRLHSIGEQSFWTDEAYTALVYTLPPEQLLARLVVDDLHPPLYPLFVDVWAWLFGTGEVALRLPSALFGAALVPAVAGLTWRLFSGRLGEVAGWLAAGLTALSPPLTVHSQEARNTTLVGLEATLATWALAHALEGAGQPSGASRWPSAGRAWLLYGALAVALVYTHYVGFLVLAAHGLYVLSAAPRRLPWLAAALSGVAVLYLPWAPSAYWQLTQYRTYLPSVFSAPTVTAELLSSYVSGVVPPGAIRPNLPPLGIGLLGLLALALGVAPRSGRAVLLPLLVGGVPIAAMLVVWSVVPKISPRYLVPVAPSAYVVVAWALAALLTGDGAITPALSRRERERNRPFSPSEEPWRRARPLLLAPGALLAVGALGLSAWGLTGAYAEQKDDYRGLVAELAMDAGPNDAVVTLMELDEPVRYYYRGPLPVDHMLARDDFASIAARLNGALAGKSNAWLVTFGEPWADPSGYVRHALGEHSPAPIFDRWYGTTRLTGFRLDPSRPFTAQPNPTHPVTARFANGVELVGWDVLGGEIMAGRESGIDWHWRATRPDTPDFKVVATVEDGTGRELVRLDRTPATLLWDPPRWRVGEVVHGQQRFTLPAVTPPGAYQVHFWIYDPATLREIPVVDADGQPLGTRVAAGELPVQPSPDRLPDEAVGLARLAQPIDFGGPGQPVLRLVAFEGPKAEPREGQPVELGLAWRALTKPPGDLEAVVRMKVGDRVVGEVPFPPVAGYPTGRWSDGALFVEHRQLLLPPEVAGGRLDLELGLRDAATRTPLATGGAPFARLATLRVKERPANKVVPPIQHRLEATFGGTVRLLGYDVAESGGQLKVTLYWQALERVERREKVFVHLVDAREAIVGQHDAEPPVSTPEWKPGEVVADAHLLPSPPGEYRLRAGLYDALNEQRLPVAGRDAGTPPTFVDLGRVEVGR